MTGDVLSSQCDLDLLGEVAQHRELWKDLVGDVLYNHYKLWCEKEQTRADARRAAK